MIFLYLLLIIFFSFLLVKATDILIISFRSLARRSKVGQFALTGLVLAGATSLPELFVSLAASLRGNSNLALGNIIGSNIANLSLVIGGAAVVGGSLQVRGGFLRRDVFYAFLAGSAPMILLFDRVLSRSDGLILLAVYCFYQFLVFGGRSIQVQGEKEEKTTFRLWRQLNHSKARRELAWIFFGVGLLLFSAEILVRLAVLVAGMLNLPVLLIGLFVVAVGTSLPELAFEIEAIRGKQAQMAMGNLLGSVVTNGTLIIGIASLISPVRIVALKEYLLATVAFVFIFGCFYLFIRTKHRLDRWEGVLLICVYIIFFFLELNK